MRVAGAKSGQTAGTTTEQEIGPIPVHPGLESTAGHNKFNNTPTQIDQ